MSPSVNVADVPRQALEDVLSDDAVGFVVELHQQFGEELSGLLEARDERQKGFDAGELPDFLTGTRDVRADGSWSVKPAPEDLVDRRVEITGPVERKMMINALNSGANVFMACFEDATSPTWENILSGQVNVRDAVRREISFDNPDGRTYELNDETATLIIRPRGLHLKERNVTVDGRAVSASLFDAGLFLFHNANELVDRGSGPYLYVPKMEAHQEAAWWNRVCAFAEERLGLERGTIAVSVLVETILAAYEMDEILYELRERPVALNAGRWDYIFSVIKKLRHHDGAVLPDRQQVTMNVPFMRRYSELLVKTAHRRGAHAIGGMAAFVPSRRDEEINRVAMAKVREDKERDAEQGYDGSWVAHPDLVPICRDAFDAKLSGRRNQLDVGREDVDVTGAALRDFKIPGSSVTREGLRNNISVGLRYVNAWLGGLGAVAIDNLMEDAATAEISRSQIWQWLNHRTALEDGTRVDLAIVSELIDQEMIAAQEEIGEGQGRLADARTLFEKVALGTEFIEFLTVPAEEFL